MSDILNLSIVALGGFFAAFLNSIIGGGGLISVPVLMLLNIPPHTVLGTNKLASSTGLLASVFFFIKEEKINYKIVTFCIPFSFLGAYLGFLSIMNIDGKFLYYITPFLIIILALYTVLSKKFGIDNSFTKTTKLSLILGIFLAFTFGFYDGFFGPGTGLFLVFGLTKIFKTDLIFSSGNSKVLNFVSNVTAFIFFASSGNINYTYGIFMAVFMIIGGIIGSKFAINGGVKFIKPIFLIVSIASCIGIIYKNWF